MIRALIACLVATLIIFAVLVARADGGASRDGGARVTDPSMSTVAAPRDLVSLPSDPDVSDFAYFARLIVGAAKHKQWRLLCGLGLVLLTWALRTLGAKRIPWLATDRGGVALILGTSLFTALATLALSKMQVNADSITDAVTNGLIAAGGYAMIKKLWAPAAKPPAPPAPPAPDKRVVAAGAA